MADIEENSKYSISENEESSSFCSSFRLLGKFIVFIIKVNFKLFVNFLHGIWRFVVPKTKKKIEGQVVLVTGGANGIGKEIVLEFARKKCKIAIVDIDCEAACKLAEELRNEFKIEAKAFRVDVSNYEEVYELRGLVQDALGTVDILVNNAAIVTTNISLLEGSYEEIQKIVDVNLTSNLWLIRVFIKGMIENRRGHIVAISSMLGKTTRPLSATYAATKHGICGLMDSLSCDLNFFELDFIKTTTVYPLFINTRKEIVELIRECGSEFQFNSSEKLAKAIVEGVRKNQRNIYFPSKSKFMLFEKVLPNKISLYARNFPLFSESKKKITRESRRNELMKALDLKYIAEEV